MERTGSRAAVNLRYLASLLPCQAACPVGTHAGGYASLIAQGRDREAYALARGPNPFASVCGRICGHPCEAACRRGQIDAPLELRALKRFASESAGIEAKRDFAAILELVEKPRPPSDKGGRIAVVGAGPAGLSCAHDLALMGHKVVVFDAAPVAGGMMRLGIPAFRLPRHLIELEIDFIRWLGVELRLGVEIGRDVSLADLERDFDCLFLAPGCRRGKGLQIPGAALPGVMTALDFLAHVHLDQPLQIGARVVVVGGGGVASDVARTARRLPGGAALDAARTAARLLNRDVTMVALEPPDELPADPREIEEAAAEGVKLLPGHGPVEVLARSGRTGGLRVQAVSTLLDEEGRFAPQLAPGTDRTIEADTVILAVGQVADLSFLGDEHGLALSEAGFVAVDPDTLATSRAAVFAGGDIVFGPRLLIHAVADGRRAALGIDSHITGRGSASPQYRMRRFPTFGYEHAFARGDYEQVPRQRVPETPVTARAHETEVQLTLSVEAARTEGSRCLHCWVHTIFNDAGGSDCIQCGGCVDVCPEACIDLVSLRRVELGPEQTGPANRGAALIKDESACIRCGLCARRCPTGLITMQSVARADQAGLLRLAEETL